MSDRLAERVRLAIFASSVTDSIGTLTFETRADYVAAAEHLAVIADDSVEHPGDAPLTEGWGSNCTGPWRVHVQLVTAPAD